jgi:hypothetical protein
MRFFHTLAQSVCALAGLPEPAAAWRTRHSAHAEDLTVRRAVVLIYATAVAYFFYAPWNYVLLGVLLLRRQRR